MTEEKNYYNDATRRLHRLSQKWLSLGQDCEDFHIQLTFLIKTCTTFTKGTATWKRDSVASVCDHLKALQSQAAICRRWTKNYRERTSICINLVSLMLFSE